MDHDEFTTYAGIVQGPCAGSSGFGKSDGGTCVADTG